MHPVLANKLDKLDQLLESLYAELKKQPDELLNRQPAPGKWSVLQVMHHLVLAEGLSEKYVRKKLSFGGDIPQAGFAGAWRLFLLNLNFSLPLKFKAPKGVGDEALPENSTLEETMAAWRAGRHSLRELMQSLPDDHYSKALYKHPLAGKLSLGQMLYFFDFHMRRHIVQIRRTLSALEK